MLITKADHRKEEFSEKKLIASIRRAGIPENMQTQVLMHVKSKLYEGIPTSEIYHHITEFLGKSSSPFTKTRFSIKQALMDLGPTGYPFEDYLARLLTHMGYQTQTRVIVQGKCVSHEIDVIATKDNEKVMVEAKYHNSTGVTTDVHVALYTWARFEDATVKNTFTKAMLITNTKLTSDAIAYGECVGMELLGWSYPEHGGLRDLVDTYQLFPITALTQLSLSQKQQLLAENIILCKDICHNPDVIDSLHLSEDQKQEILKEANFVCQIT